MIIDAHVHLIGLDPDNGCHLGPKLLRGPLLFNVFTRILGLKNVPREKLDDAFQDMLLTHILDSTLDACGILAFDGVYDAHGKLDMQATQMMIGNDHCLSFCQRHEKLLPVCSVNPARRDAIDELERVIEAGTVAIKTLPNSQGFDPLDDTYRPFWRIMAKHGVPLLSHTSFEHTVPPINQLFGHPLRLRGPLEEGVTVIAAHCAGAGVAHPIREHFGVWLSMLEEYPNLYGDISAMASISRFPYIHKVMASSLARSRVIMGSDFPVPVSPAVFLPQLGVSQVRRLSRIKNPIQQNYETFHSLGVPGSVMRRAAHVLRLPEELEQRIAQE